MPVYSYGMFSTGLVMSLFTTLVLSKAVPRNPQIHEARQAAPSGYVLSGSAASDTMLSLRLALVQNNVDGLIDSLYDVSDPTNAKYGKHLSKTEVEAFVAPRAESVAAVNTWLSENDLNATVLSPAGDWLGISIPVNKTNDLLSADYSVFTHETSGIRTVRTLSYSLPQELIGHIDLIHPTITFPSAIKHSPVILSSQKGALSRPVQSSDNTSAVCGLGDTFMTPACLQYIYDIPSTPATSSTNGLAVTAYDGEYAQESDLQSFLAEYRSDMNSSTAFTYQSVNEGQNPQNGSEAGIEANLDTQYTVGLATGVPVTFISVGGDFDDALLDTANYLLGLESPPQVVSTSYGDNEDAFSQKLANNLCNAYAQLGARGVSVLFASGDGGVSGNQEGQCTTFVPTFPSGCPYVTSVGATTQLPTEVAASFSGGGFSNYWSRPDYQSSAVSSFLSALGNNDTGLYNASGRAYPDVSAYGNEFDIYNDKETLEVSGTSCSTPTFASIVALLNDQLLAAGKSTLGFLNPFLYSTGASAFTDILAGNNLACSNGTTGFYAVKGWDPVTGLGTPNFTSLKSAAGL